MKAILVGCGRVGIGYSMEGRPFDSSHFGALIRNPDIDHVILVDKDEKRLNEVSAWVVNQQDYIGGKTVSFDTDYIEPIKKYNPEIGVVAVPTAQHYAVVKDLAHSKGPDILLVEKPIAESLDVANMLANRCAYVYGLTEQRKPRVAVNLSRRWHPCWQRVKELIDSGSIGKVAYAVGHHPGALLRSGVHMLDLFNWYFGELATVRSLAVGDSWMQKYPDTDDFGYDAQITYKNGVIAYFLGAALAETPYQLFELEIYAEKAQLCVMDNGSLIIERHVNPSEDYGGLPALDPIEHARGGWESFGLCNPMSLMVEDLVQCVKEPKRQPACTLENALQADMVAHLIRQSNFKVITPDDLDLKATVKTV